MIASGAADVLADLTLLWSSIRAVRRGTDGRFPVRSEDDPAISTGLAAYTKAAVVRQALRDGLNVVVTAAEPGQVTRWQAVAEEAGTTFQVRTIDPGEAVVRQRLADPETGVLADECERAVGRWYG